MGARTRALIYALLALLVGGLAYLLGVGSTLGQRAEASVLDASAFTADPPAPLSLVSTGSVIVALIVVGLISLWAHGFGRTLSILLFGSAAIVVSQLLKESWLDRPQLFELDASNTFPSGHMTVFAVLSGGLIWAVPKGIRALVLVMSALLLGVVSWQLLNFGWHRPSDLLGAQALAVLAFAIAAWIGPRGSRTSARMTSAANSFVSRLALVVLTVGGIALVLGGLVLVAVAASTRSDALMLNAGEIAMMGVGALAARTFAKLCP